MDVNPYDAPNQADIRPIGLIASSACFLISAIGWILVAFMLLCISLGVFAGINDADTWDRAIRNLALNIGIGSAFGFVGAMLIFLVRRFRRSRSDLPAENA